MIGFMIALSAMKTWKVYNGSDFVVQMNIIYKYNILPVLIKLVTVNCV